MVPYGFGTQLPPDYNDLISVSKVGANALKNVYGTLICFKFLKIKVNFKV